MIEVIESSAKAIYPHIFWHVSETLEGEIEILGTVSFYAKAYLPKEALEANPSKTAAIEIEGVMHTLQALAQDWLEK